MQNSIAYVLEHHRALFLRTVEAAANLPTAERRHWLSLVRAYNQAENPTRAMQQEIWDRLGFWGDLIP